MSQKFYHYKFLITCSVFSNIITFPLSSYFIPEARILVSLFSVILIVIISGMAAYVLARIDFRINRCVYLLIVAGFAIPPAAVLVPLYATVSNLGLLNSIYGVVMPLTAFGIPFTVILFYAFFLDFPKEVEEAATIDGCSKMQIFFRIIIPLSGPAIASAAIFQTVWILSLIHI